MNNKKTLSKTVFSMIVKIRYLILLIIAVITVFFAFQLTKLRVSGDYSFITSNLEPSEFVVTPKYNEEKAKELIALIAENNKRKAELETQQAEHIKEISRQYATTEIAPSSYTQTKSDKVLKPAAHYYDGFAIVITSEKLFTIEILSLISEMMDKMEAYPITGTCLSPFSFVTFTKNNSRIVMTPMNPHTGYGPWTQEEVDIFLERLMNDDVASNYMYDRKTNSVMLYYMNEYASDADLLEMRSYLEPLRNAGCTIAVTGLSTITERLMYYLNKDLATLLLLCILIILINYGFFFRTVSRILIPFSMSIIGIVWTLGWMAMKGFALTLVTLLTPCLVLILGSSYSIHMLSEYMFEAENPDQEKKALAINTSKNIYKTILLAGITTLIGFISLTLATTQAFKEFGLCISVGVAFCIILSLTYLPAILSVIKRPKPKKVVKNTNSIFTSFVNRIARLSTRGYIVTIVIVSLVIVTFLLTKNQIQYDSNYMSYFPTEDEIIQENVYFAQTMGGTDPFYFTIRAPENEKDYFLRPEVLERVFLYEEAVLANCPDIVQSLSFPQYVAFINRIYSGERMIPKNKGMINTVNRYVAMIKNQTDSDVLDLIINDDATEITLSMRNYDAVAQDLQTTASSRRIAQTLDEYRYLLPEGTSSRISCYAYDLSRGNDVVMKDQRFTTILAFCAVFFIALITFRSIKYSMGVMIPVACGIMSNYIFMWLFGINFDLITVGFSSIAIGIGIDDALHFTARYINRKKEASTEAVSEILTYTIQRTGKPIIETTTAIVCGMMALTLGNYAPIRYFGLIMCVTLMSTNIATLFALPAYLSLTDRKKGK